MQDLKVKGFNRNFIKYVAVFAMIIDHVGLFFIPLSSPVGLLFRIFGRLTCPIMCYFLAEGFYYTKSKLKYALRLFTFAIISQFAYTYALYGNIFIIEFFTDYNILFTLFLSFCILLCYTYINNLIAKLLSICILISLSYFCDWGIIAPLFVLSFYIYKNNKNAQTLAFTFLSFFTVIYFTVLQSATWFGQLWQFGLLLFIPLIYLYNSEKGSFHTFHKWSFYVIYPLHLLIFGVIASTI